MLSVILVSIALNVILFLTVPDGRTGEGVFWLAWSFTFPFNIAVTVLSYLYLRSKNSLVAMPITYYVTGAAYVVYLIVGAIFMYAPIVSFTVPVIVEVVITVIYLIVLMWSLFAVRYISDNQKVTDQKVLFIRLLKSDVDGILPFCTDPAIRSRLERLSEKIRFSDPMSHPSLAGCESELNAAVYAISAKVKAGECEGIEAEITKVNALLDFRNDRCKILK